MLVFWLCLVIVVWYGCGLLLNDYLQYEYKKQVSAPVWCLLMLFSLVIVLGYIAFIVVALAVTEAMRWGWSLMKLPARAWQAATKRWRTV
jgi:hypothetical protein